MTPTQTLTLIAEEIEAGAEALFGEVKADLSWRAIAEAHRDMWRQRSAAVLVAAGAVRKAAAPAVPPATERETAIEDEIAACRECGGREFPKRADCRDCIAAVEARRAEDGTADGTGAASFLSGELQRAQGVIHDVHHLIQRGRSETALARLTAYWAEWATTNRAARGAPRSTP